jgi:hypothetical protein
MKGFGKPANNTRTLVLKQGLKYSETHNYFCAAAFIRALSCMARILYTRFLTGTVLVLCCMSVCVCVCVCRDENKIKNAWEWPCPLSH